MDGRGIRLTGAAALLFGFLACADESRPAQPMDGDPALFVEEVQPIVHGDPKERTGCAFLGCHGREGMPLTLYAVDYLRLRDPEGVIDPTLPALDERALSQAEIDHNRRAIAARVGPDDPSGERLLRRLLPPKSGGIPHAGVTVYESESDPDYVVLRRFLGTVRAR